jgi:hypothetical protein
MTDPRERLWTGHWQLAVTHWTLADGDEVKILDQIYDHSLASDTRAPFKAADVVPSVPAPAPPGHPRPPRAP